MEIIKVSSKSKCSSLAGAITNILKENKTVEAHTVGAGALNQLVKSIIISKGFLAPLGIEITCIPSFTDIKIENEKKTGIKMLIKKIEKN